MVELLQNGHAAMGRIIAAFQSYTSYEEDAIENSDNMAAAAARMQAVYTVMGSAVSRVKYELDAAVFEYPPLIRRVARVGVLGFCVDATNAAGDGHIYVDLQDFSDSKPFSILNPHDVVKINSARNSYLNDKIREVLSIKSGGTGVRFTEDFEEDAECDSTLTLRVISRD